MNVLDELVNYCNDPEPVGALMLTGEWGCGKTYFVDHDFAESIKGKCIIVRISLFGIDSIEVLRKNIGLAWLNALIEDSDECAVQKLGAKLKKQKEKLLSLIGKTGKWGEIIQEIGNIFTIDLYPIKPTINQKTVVLIFDDMERSQLGQTDLLGCINDYCENQHFHIIIVANEEKMSESRKAEPKESKGEGDVQHIFVENLYTQEIKEEIPYREIKEKTIQRTVAYVPNYETIISSIIDAYKLPNRESPDYDQYKSYKEMLMKHKSELVEIFETGISCKTGKSQSGEEKIESMIPPHNLRSFKCAIHDFVRVYKILQKFKMEEIERYLFSFVAFVMDYRAGKNANGENIYRQEYALNTVKKWVLESAWEEKEIEEEIQYIQHLKKAYEPVDIVRLSLIIDLEEDVIQKGFPDVLQLAYSGDLDLNDYVNLIINSCLSRKFEYLLPEEIDWEKITAGIEIRFQKMIDEGKDDYYRSIIKGIDLKPESGYSDQEKAAYQLIDEFRKSDKQIFAINRKLYIDGMRKYENNGLITYRNKQFDVFDKEMAEVTVIAFRQEKNMGKRVFISEFSEMWKERCSSKYELRVEDSIEGFKCLENLLSEEKTRLQKQNLKISEIHTKNFIEKIEEMIKLLSSPA